MDSRNPNHITLTPGYEINFAYVDGVSVTYGSPHQHIWTLYGSYTPDRCCGAVDTLLPFNENSSFCDTGHFSNHIRSDQFRISLTLHSGMAFLDVVMLAAVLLTLVRGLTLP